MQQAVWPVNPSLPLADVRSAQELYERLMSRTSFALTILAIAAGMALLLGIGLCGTAWLSQASAWRAGSGLRSRLMRWMSTLLFEVKPIDPVTYGAVAVVLLSAALTASDLPARRTTTIEPVGICRRA